MLPEPRSFVREKRDVDARAPVQTALTFIAFRQDLNRLLTRDSIVLTNNIFSELLCGWGPTGNSVLIFVTVRSSSPHKRTCS